MREKHLRSARGQMVCREFVVVDPEVADADILLRSLGVATTVVLLRRGIEPLGQIAAALGGVTGVRRLHVLSHGAPGRLRLAGRDIDRRALLAHPSILAAMRGALAGGGEMVLYGCSVAAGASGARFVAGLAAVLGVSVIASDVPVGNPAVGGSWQAFPDARCAFGAAGRAAYPGLLASGTIAFEDASSATSVTSSNNGVTLTVSIDANTVTGGDRIIDIAAGGGFAGTAGNFLLFNSDSITSATTMTFSFNQAVGLTSFRFVEVSNRDSGTYTFTPDSGTAISFSATDLAANTGTTVASGSGLGTLTQISTWTNVSSFTVTYSGGTANWSPGFDTFVFADATPTAATSTAAGFNTTNGTNLTPALTFSGADETLTIGASSHITGSTADGGAGTDTIIAPDGSDFANFTLLQNFETLTLAANATVTMSESQHDGFTTINGNTGTEAITLTTVNGDGNVTGDDGIETYNLNGAYTFTIGTAGQNVTGNDGADQTVQSSAAIDTLGGTLNGGAGGSDTLVLDTGDNIAGATVSNFENLTLESGGSFTMTVAQHDGFTGTVTAGGTEQITFSATGGDTTTTGNSAVETYVLGTGGISFTLGAAAQNVTGSSGADTVNVGTFTATGTLNGQGNTDTLSMGAGSSIAGATVTNFENLTLASGASVTINASQLSQFAGTITANGTETINITGDGAFTTLANVETFSVGDDTTDARTITVANATNSVSATSNSDAITFSVGNVTYTGTLTGEGTAGDTLSLNDGANISGATISAIGTLDVVSGATVTMTEEQHDAFTTITGTGTNKIVISATTDGLTGDADIEQYQLSTANSFTLGAASQSVTGSTGNDTINVGTLSPTGTLSGGSGTDTLSLGTGADISGATVSGFENLTLASGASVTMTEAQHDAFSSITAAGTETITISAATNGFATNSAIENYILSVANACTVSGGAQNITGSTGNDTITFQGLTYTGTLSGAAGTDVIQMTTGTDISGATVSGVENLTLAGNASVTMTVSQLAGFSGAISAGGSETLNLSGDGDFSTTTSIESYVVGDSTTDTRTITITNAGHSASATSATDAVTFDTGTLTLTGTLTGEGTVNDTLSIGNGANISGATISGIENLTLATGASVTMTSAQLAGFTGTVTAAGTETVTLTATGDVSAASLSTIETLATAADASAQTITLTGAQASGKTLTAGDSGSDHFVVTASTGTQSITGSAGADTLSGGAGADTLAGGAGADSLVGGADTDRFTGSVSDLNGDTIADLAAGETILLTGVTGLATANVRFNGTTLEIDTNATTFASPEVTINTVSNLSSTLNIASVTDSGANTLITLGSASVSATTNAAGFNTTNGTNLTPASTFAGTDDTLTVASSTHITSTSVADGGAGTDTIVLADGSDLTTTGFTFTGFETLTLAANATAIMSESQHDGFTTINGNTGTEVVTLTTVNGDGNVTGDADIETYNLNGAYTFTLGAAGQNVTGSDGADQTVQSSASIDTLTGTLNGGAGGSDTLVLDDGDNLTGATVSNFENLSMTGASVTMTAAQLNGFTGTTTATGTGPGSETVTLTTAGTIASASVTGIETIATAADAGAQTVTLTAAQAAGKTLTTGDSGSDHFVITGSAGSQAITGSAGADTIDGGADADTVIGGNGDDAVSGGAGADVVSGGSGFDTLAGGAGNDTFSGSASDFNGDTISDFAVGDSIVVVGADLSNLNGTAASASIDISGAVATTLTGITSASGTFSAALAGGNTTITLVAPASSDGGDGGGGGGGTLIVNDTSNTNTTGGARTITNNSGSAGTAAIVENTGNNGNIVTATLPPAVSISSEGPATAQSGQGAVDTLITAIQTRGSTGEPGLVGNAQTFLNNLAATSTLDVRTIVPTQASGITTDDPIVITGTTGGSQSEAFVIDMRSISGKILQLDNIEFASIIGNATVTGGSGDNYATGDDNAQFISLGEGNDTLYGGDGADTIGSGGGNDSLFGDGGTDSVFGGTGADSLWGGTEADVVYGNQQDDLLYGNQQDDTLYGGQDADTVYGGQDSDLLYGNFADDFLYGNLGADTLFGGQGNDALFGGQGNDLLIGNLGDDTLHGNRGDDTISGGDGADLIVVEKSNGVDVVADFDGAAGDQVQITANANGTSIDTFAELQAAATTNAGGNVEIALGGGNTLTLNGVTASDLQSGWFLFA